MRSGRFGAYSLVELMDKKPEAIRSALWLAPTGMALLLLATFLAASTYVCTDACIRKADSREDRLLICIDHCEVNPEFDTQQKSTCEKDCQQELGFTRRQVRRKQKACKEGCQQFPGAMRFFAIVAVMILLPVSPMLANYPGSCRCECCQGEGCSPRLALLNVAWVCYGFSCFWSMPTVLEDPHELSGKMLFGFAQGVSITAMFRSRLYAEKELDDVPMGRPVGMPVNGLPVARAIAQPPPGVIVGAPVTGSSNEELQAQVQQLQSQVREMVRLQTLQVQAQAKPQYTAPAVTPAAAPAAAPPPSSQDIPLLDLLPTA